MNPRSLISLFLLSLSLAVSGCGGPGPEEPCSKYLQLRKSDDREAGDAEKSKCVEVLTEFKADNPQAWQCVNGCIDGAGSSKEADECPWACETNYGGADGNGLSGTDAKVASQEKWARGINGDALTAEEEAKEAILAAGAGEFEATESCMSECKKKHEGESVDTQRDCVQTCKESKGY